MTLFRNSASDPKGYLKDRVAIPLHDHEGKLVGYAGRVVDDAAITKDNPRYRLPGTRKRAGKIIEFRKTLFLYNGYRIHGPVDNLVVTEGFASIWWLHQHGHPHSVAAMGSDFSERQAELVVSLVKPAGRVWVLPDGDDAGRRFAQSALLQVSPHRFVRWVKITEGSQATDLSEEQLKSCLPTTPPDVQVAITTQPECVTAWQAGVCCASAPTGADRTSICVAAYPGGGKVCQRKTGAASAPVFLWSQRKALVVVHGWNERGGIHLRRRWGKRGIDVAQGGVEPQRMEPETIHLRSCETGGGKVAGKRGRFPPCCPH